MASARQSSGLWLLLLVAILAGLVAPGRAISDWPGEDDLFCELPEPPEPPVDGTLCEGLLVDVVAGVDTSSSISQDELDKSIEILTKVYGALDPDTTEFASFSWNIKRQAGSSKNVNFNRQMSKFYTTEETETNSPFAFTFGQSQLENLRQVDPSAFIFFSDSYPDLSAGNRRLVTRGANPVCPDIANVNDVNEETLVSCTRELAKEMIRAGFKVFYVALSPAHRMLFQGVGRVKLIRTWGMYDSTTTAAQTIIDELCVAPPKAPSCVLEKTKLTFQKSWNLLKNGEPDFEITETPEDCEKLCDENPGCKVWTWKKAGRDPTKVPARCYLLKKYGRVRTSNAFTSGGELGDYCPTPEPTQAPTDAPTPFPTEAPTDAPTAFPTEAPTPEPTFAPLVQRPGCILEKTRFVTTPGGIAGYWANENAVAQGILSAENCHAKCEEVEACKYWSYFDAANKNCKLFKYITAVQTNKGAYTSGPKFCTEAPTDVPTAAPTQFPTDSPTAFPTLAPSDAPTDSPTAFPTLAPTDFPSDAPTPSPFVQVEETPAPTPETPAPTDSPTDSPTAFPTLAPSDAPTDSPTAFPTLAPSDAPTDSPTQFPTLAPSDAPTDSPTQFPTLAPSDAPTDSPTQFPTGLGECSAKVAMAVDVSTSIRRADDKNTARPEVQWKRQYDMARYLTQYLYVGPGEDEASMFLWTFSGSLAEYIGVADTAAATSETDVLDALDTMNDDFDSRNGAATSLAFTDMRFFFKMEGEALPPWNDVPAAKQLLKDWGISASGRPDPTSEPGKFSNPIGSDLLELDETPWLLLIGDGKAVNKEFTPMDFRKRNPVDTHFTCEAAFNWKDNGGTILCYDSKNRNDDLDDEVDGQASDAYPLWGGGGEELSPLFDCPGICDQIWNDEQVSLDMGLSKDDTYSVQDGRAALIAASIRTYICPPGPNEKVNNPCTGLNKSPCKKVYRSADGTDCTGSFGSPNLYNTCAAVCKYDDEGGCYVDPMYAALYTE